MVDHDIFRTHVDPGFQRAARAVFDRTDPTGGVLRALHAASVALKEGGCPGLREVELIVLDLAKRGSGSSSGDRDRALRALDDVKRSFVNDRTSVAVEAARRLIRSGEFQTQRQIARADMDVDLPLGLIAKFVLLYVDRQLFPGGLLQALVESRRETWDSWSQRRQEFLRALERSDGLIKIAAELHADPTGSQVRRQYSKQPKADQYALATTFALT